MSFMPYNTKTLEGLVAALEAYWAAQGCVIMPPLDMEIGAGTFHPASFLGAIGPEPARTAYLQPSRRPTDGRYGDNPNRLQRHHQFQVVLKPAPLDIQALYLGSLEMIGIDPLVDDIRFVEDNWESPTLGAFGLGWEVWLNGMEVTQFTYFQQVGGLECKPITGEITYGIERLSMVLQGVNNVYDLVWSENRDIQVTYGDLYKQTEIEMSRYNFELADVDGLFNLFQQVAKEAERLIEAALPLPAYEMVLKASHTFNLLDARHALSVTERQNFILNIRRLAKAIAQSYYQSRERLGFPLQSKSAKQDTGNSPVAQKPDTLLHKEQREDLLIELLTEELPSKSLEALAFHLFEQVKGGLQKAELAFSHGQYFATPRRLALWFQDLNASQPSQYIERRGPSLLLAFDADGNPTRACQGFARSQGVTPEVLITIKQGANEFVGLRETLPGKDVFTLVPSILEQAIKALPMSRRMRWGEGQESFVRPVHGVLLLYGKKVIAATLFGCTSGKTTRGHRFLAQGAIEIHHPSLYLSLLTDGYVMADLEVRKALIVKQATEVVQEVVGHGARPLIPDDLLLEVTGLVEWPVALCGAFDQEFLQLPSEVLISAMQDHQRYFPVVDTQHQLLPYFVTVSNIASRDVRRVIAGNERVLRARLADAAFFFAQDKKMCLFERVVGLKDIIFQAKLGTLFAKSERLSLLVASLSQARDIPHEHAIRAALLAKADLTSAMVAEFPELQGIMGYYYALHDGEPFEVAEALKEYYQPRFAGDRLPETALGQILAIADRVDTLVGIFGIHQIPTGDKDPFALRRAALSFIRIVIEKELNIELKPLLQSALLAYGKAWDVQEISQQVLCFIEERLRAWYQEQGITADVFAAVAALGLNNILDMQRRIQAVMVFKNLQEAESLCLANKRVSNILNKAQDKLPHHSSIDPELFEHAAEGALLSSLQAKSEIIAPLLAAHSYVEVLLQLAELRGPIDTFFDQVMVMAEDKTRRINRLLLLNKLRGLFLQVADIALLQ